MTLPVLNLPIQSSKRPKPYLKVKMLREWQLSLPGANAIKSAQLTLQQLRTLNQSRYPYAERVQLLDTLRPTVRQLLVSLKQNLRRAGFPLSTEHRQQENLIQDLLNEMAQGYKVVASELMNKNSRKENDQLLLRETIYLSIQYLARCIVESYLVYSSPQYDIWRELHQLYRYAEYHQLQNKPVDDPFPDYELPVQYTIDLVYKRIVLLSLAAPYHLMQHEAEDIYYLVSAWTSACHIVPMDKRHISNQYGVDFATDMSPRFIPESLEWEPVDGRIIDISEVKQRLDHHLEKVLRHNFNEVEMAPGVSAKATLHERQQRDMLLRLADAWHGTLYRQDQRKDRGARLRIAVGLNACHFYSSNKAEFTPEMDELRLISSATNSNSTMFAKAYREALHKDRLHGVSNYPVSPWQQRNVSHAGIALRWDKSQARLDVKVGEVVAYLFESRTGLRWQIGIIRWIQVDNDNNIDMGIMNLANSAVPVAAKAIKGLGKGTDYFRSLLIPKQVSLKQQRSLVLPASLYDVGSVLSVNMKTKLFYVKLTHMVLSTRTIAVFEFDVLDQPPVDIHQEEAEV